MAKLRKSILFSIIGVILFSIVSCNSNITTIAQNDSNIINPPSKIIMHYRTLSKEVTPNNKLFNDLLKLTNSRFDNEQSLMINSTTEIKYYKLFFKLEESPFVGYIANEDENSYFQYSDRKEYQNISFGKLNSSSELIKTIENEFK